MKNILLILHKIIGPLIGFGIGMVFLFMAISGAAKGHVQPSGFVIAGVLLVVFSLLGALIIFQVLKGKLAMYVGVGLSLVISLFLSWKIVRSVGSELEYIDLVKQRYSTVVQHLKKIREAELAYKEANGKYTKDWNALIEFIKNGKYPILKRVGNMDDSVQVASGQAHVDTNWVPVIGNGYIMTFPVDSLRFVPYNKNGKEFFLDAGELFIDDINRAPVFLSSTEYADFMDDLWKEYGRLPVDSTVRVGSMDEITTNGNFTE